MRTVCNVNGFVVVSSEAVVFGSGSEDVPCNSLGDVVVEENGVLNVSGFPFITGNLRVGGTLVVKRGNKLVVRGNVTLGPNARAEFDQPNNNLPPLEVTQRLSFGGRLFVNIYYSPYGNSGSQRRQDGGLATVAPVAGGTTLTVPVAQFASSSGSFVSVNTTVLYANSCDVYPDPPPVAAYGASTMSVTVSVARDPSNPACNLAGGLSGGAIAGIVVGSVVGAAALVTLLLILWRRKELGERTARFNKQIANQSPGSPSSPSFASSAGSP